MNVPWLVAGVVVGLWLVILLLQLGDVATVFLDSRTARDRDAQGRIARERTNELFWVIPVVAILALAVGVGIDRIAHLFFSERAPELGSLFLLGLATIVVGMGGLALAAVAATDPTSYSALRRELRDLDQERLTPAQLAGYRARLARVDARTRSRMRHTRVVVTPASVLRLLCIVAGIIVVVAVGIAAVISPTSQSASLVWISVVAPVLSGVFAALGIRLSVSSDVAWRRVYARQRAEVIGLLEGFERSSRKRVAGLGDRVARALQILREQQR